MTQRELDRVTIFSIAEMARKRRARGLKLNHPEAMALICDEILEEVRAGRSYDDVVAYARTVLSAQEVMEGVPELIPVIQVEGTFADGTKLITVTDPIR